MIRKTWIDNLRGFCIMAILLDYTELYYTGINIIDYNAYVVNALVLFFVLSGYLMYKQNHFSFKQKVCSIQRTLIVPYFIFTTLIAILKTSFHTNNLNIQEAFIGIITGQASWFVAALIVAELLFSLAIWIGKGKNTWLFSVGAVGFCISIYLSTKPQPYIWQIDNAMQALLFLCMGYAYHKYESYFKCLAKLSNIVILFVLLIVTKLYEHQYHINMLIWNIHINNYPVFLFDITICCLLMITLFKLMPSLNWLAWTGRHSLVYYFLCGGIPMSITTLLNRMGFIYQGNYIYIVVAFTLVYVVSTLITYVIYQYFPIITGHKYEKKEH